MVGRANTGKTTAIRQFVKLCGWEKLHGVEVKIVLPYKDKWIGVASKGDSEKDVSTALNALHARDCDVIVCAARPNKVYAAVTQFASQEGYQLHVVSTPYGGVVASDIMSAANKVARLIKSAI